MVRWMSVCLLICMIPIAEAAGDEGRVFSGFGSKGRDAIAADKRFVEGSDGWRFLPAELVFAAKLHAQEQDPKITEAIAAITDFAAQLREQDIELIVVPVPPKTLLHRAFLDPAAAAVDAEAALRPLREIHAQLRDAGVRVLDLSDTFAAEEDSAFCRRDTHWSGKGIRLAARAIAEELAKDGITPSAGQPFSVETRAVSIRGDLGGDAEDVELDFVYPRDGQPGTVNTADRDSPVLVLGDSHVLVFHEGGDLHETGAGLPDALAAELGAMPDILGVRGSGATASRISLARRARADEDYLPGKRAVVWCFAAREFTEADAWREIPLLP